MPYAELHCHSNFSFLDGASHPEELVEQAARLGLDALALTDHDGMYGVVRFAEAAAELGVATIFGAELSLGLSAPQNGVPDPEGSHLLLLARDPDGYRALCRVISAAQLRGREKGRPVYRVDEIVEQTAGHVVALTGCRKGAVRQALAAGGPVAAEEALGWLVERFGREGVAVELTHQALPGDTERNDALAALAARAGLPTVATTGAHYAEPGRYPLAAAMAAVRSRRSLDEADGWLPPAGTARLRSGAEMAARFEDRYPGAVARPRRSAGSVPSPSTSSRPTCRRSRSPTVATRRRCCGSGCARGRCAATAARRRTPRRPRRSSARWRSSSRRSSPATS
ncbi:PHP domain-containing protein [Pseudonocardia benzenivorans]